MVAELLRAGSKRIDERHRQEKERMEREGTPGEAEAMNPNTPVSYSSLDNISLAFNQELKERSGSMLQEKKGPPKRVSRRESSMSHKKEALEMKEKNRVVTLREAWEYLQKTIPDLAAGKKEIVAICKWIEEWDKTLPEGNRNFAFMREEINVAYCIDQGSNRANPVRRPNFMVVKLPGSGDFEFSELHVDFSLGPDTDKADQKVLHQRKDPKAKSRWVLSGKDCVRLSFEDFKKLVAKAHKNKGGKSELA